MSFLVPRACMWTGRYPKLLYVLERNGEVVIEPEEARGQEAVAK